MYAISYWTRKNGTRMLNWKNSSKLQNLYRAAQLAIKAGAENVCIELEDGTFLTLN